MEMFREVLEKGNLTDLGWKGEKFTWCNRHEDESFIKERLDRVVANPEWRAIYNDFRVETLPAVCSDHRPLVLECLQWIRWRRTNFQFKYEANWLKEEGSLARERTNAIKEKTFLLSKLQENEGLESMKLQKRTQEELGFLLEQEDLKWKQRAKEKWLEGGDRNTKFYHASVNQRRKKNLIKKVVDSEGQVLTDKRDIALGFWEHFSKVYESSQPSTRCIEQCLQGVEEKITPKMRGDLEKSFTTVEVAAALKQMAPLKSPGPDGFGVGFFQDH
ncbi:hypothetical protein F2P56_032803 [Juglans regia]|uniref:Uncharacterized protein LOC108990315 n=2 Tax=Juglans regia TaxID=51240 RepID=A0A2I4EK62_JUGRE|nr:uncharacterized protein LOC108990315 [Juglans regia]KAF5447235.1 hypothetical protein F2P56_032803 [Juglans regia]